MEHLAYRISAASAENILSEYATALSAYKNGLSGLLPYFLKTELKKYMFLIIISFCAYGIWGNLLFFFLTIYRYVFLMSAFFRSHINSAYVLCICTALLCLIFYVPQFLYCIRLSYYSFLYCKDKGTMLYHCTKYQLQTELKIGIIMLLYTMLGVVVESIVYTRLLGQIFQ